MNNWCIGAVCSWRDYIWHIPYLILYKISPFGNILTYTLGTIISCLLASFSFRKNVSGIQTLVGSVNVRYLRCPFKEKEKVFFSSEMIKSHYILLYHVCHQSIWAAHHSIVPWTWPGHCIPREMCITSCFFLSRPGSQTTHKLNPIQFGNCQTRREAEERGLSAHVVALSFPLRVPQQLQPATESHLRQNAAFWATNACQTSS